METVFWVLGWFFCIIMMVVNGFVIFVVCSQRELRIKIKVLGCSLFLLAFSAALQPNALHALKPLTLICSKIYFVVMFFL